MKMVEVRIASDDAATATVQGPIFPGKTFEIYDGMGGRVVLPVVCCDDVCNAIRVVKGICGAIHMVEAP
jgi:hypothetical protein